VCLIQDGRPVTKLSADELVCIGFALEASCGRQGRYRAREGGCRPRLDVVLRDGGYFKVERIHLVALPPPFVCRVDGDIQR